MVSVGFVVVVLTILSMDLRISQATSRFSLDKPSPTADYFEQWMIKFSRVYPNEAEKQRRFEIFKDNVKYIYYFNSQGTLGFKLRLNQFGDQVFSDTYTRWKKVNTTSPSKVANEDAKEKVEDQKTVDAALIKSIEDVADLKTYLRARFSLKQGMKHLTLLFHKFQEYPLF